MIRAVLLPSPFLAARAYAPLVDALGRLGWGVVVASTTTVPDGPDAVLTAYTQCVELQRPQVVLAHSNAGRYAVTVAPEVPVVYVDAALPPSTGEATLAPEALLDHLAGLADTEGRLPPWTRWWSDEEIAVVVPDPDVLASIRAVEPRVPLSYVRGRLGAPAGWQQAPQAFLGLGRTYADELAQAGSLGWPTTVIEGAGHLHHLVDPDAVAFAVVDLASRLGVGSVRRAPGLEGTTTG